jgi:hypothetical protein
VFDSVAEAVDWRRRVYEAGGHEHARRTRRVKKSSEVYSRALEADLHSGQNPRIPHHWTLAKVRLNEKGQVQVAINPDKLKGGFARCVKAVSAKGGAYDPRAVCASSERKKYGQREMTRRAIAGKRRKARKHNPTHSYIVHVPATAHDAGYVLKIRAKTAAKAKAEARRYCAGRSGLGTSYRLPARTKVERAE